MNIQSSYSGRIDVKYEVQLRPHLKISEVKDIIFETETDSTITLVLFYGQPNKTLIFDKVTNRLKQIK